MAWVDDDNAALVTDLYELTMAASYHARGLDEPATFDLFVRRLPDRRSFLVAAGLEQALRYLERLRFDGDAVGYLRSLGMFPDPFLERLRELRFTGDVWAVPEGELVFGQEPILRVTAPLVEAQLVETFLLNCVGFQTMVASKAARVSLACGDGRSWVDFSARRDHGADAALKASRAAVIGGASGTSLVLGGRAWGVPVAGTMAHSYVMRFDDELAAFRAFARDFDGTTLLIDTYDTEEGARRVVQVAGELAAEGRRVGAVRLDSGDLEFLSRSVRAILDEGGFPDVRIFASGDLDEWRIAELVAAGAPVDAFGVGTQLGTSADAPYLGVVYKLAEAADGPRIKLSAEKATLPGRKQVHRRRAGGELAGDVIALEGEAGVPGTPLLTPVVRAGRRTGPARDLGEIRERCREAVAELPVGLRRLDAAPGAYPVELSPGLKAVQDELRAAHRRGAPAGA